MYPEFGMGAIAEGPAVVLDRSALSLLGVTRAQLLAIAHREMGEIRRRVERFRGGRKPPELRDRIVILVDDGIATGGTMRAAIRAVKKRRPARLIVAVPVAPPEVIADLREEVDDVVCLHQPQALHAIGLWYEDFRQVHDEEVVRILERAPRTSPAPATAE
jgi:putative phosphoribosyl transferase